MGPVKILFVKSIKVIMNYYKVLYYTDTGEKKSTVVEASCKEAAETEAQLNNWDCEEVIKVTAL